MVSCIAISIVSVLLTGVNIPQQDSMKRKSRPSEGRLSRESGGPDQSLTTQSDILSCIVFVLLLPPPKAPSFRFR